MANILWTDVSTKLVKPEDHAVIASYIGSKHTLITPWDGEETLKIISSGKAIDLMFLDYNLSDMFADEILRDLKRRDSTIPVVMAYRDIGVSKKIEAVGYEHLIDTLAGFPYLSVAERYLERIALN
ncbi:hypothetical protein GOV12_05575 [Candidatus Pacearchaeota archaeon]|nr:hypothetical protein [Candidatus Pacearchaeota archaeon]